MSSYGNEPVVDRLSAMRASASPDRQGRERRVRRPEIVVATVAVVTGLVILLMVVVPRRGGVVSSVAPSTTLAITNNSRVPVGMALMSFPVEPGHLPPSVRVGDRVRIVATPTTDGTGSVRVLGPVATIHEVDSGGTMDGASIVSVITDESVAASIASSGEVHVYLVGEGR